MQDRQDRLQRFDLTYGAVLDSLRHQVSAEWHASLSGQLSQIRALLSEYESQAAQVLSSGDFSSQGRAKRLKGLAHEYGTKLKGHHKTLTEYDTRIAAEQRKLAHTMTAKPRDAIEALIGELRHQEIRGHLRTLDPLLLAQEYLSAVGDPRRGEVADAIENSPTPLLNGETLADGRARRMQRQDPGQYPLVTNLTQMRQILSDALHSAMSFVQPDGDQDPLQDTAKSGA